VLLIGIPKSTLKSEPFFISLFSFNFPATSTKQQCYFIHSVLPWSYSAPLEVPTPTYLL
jgi:hypothetical protein